MDTLVHDFRAAWRALARRPAFTAAAILTLALGLGATGAIFGAVHGVLLAPLPFADAARLVVIWEDLQREHNPHFSVSAPNYRDLRTETTTLAGIAAQAGGGFRLTGGAEPELTRGLGVTGNYFTVLGARAELGRTILPSDDSSARVVVIGHALWRRRFGGDRAVIGRSLLIDGVAHSIVGVMPASLEAPVFFKAPQLSAELWLPLVLSRTSDARDIALLQLVGRLAPGRSVSDARADLSAIASRLAALYPTSNSGIGVTVVPMSEQITGAARPMLLALLGAVALLLVIATANTANLFLARALQRRGELAIRMALGASRWRIARQSLAESLAVSTAGGAIACVAAWAGIRALVAIAPPDTARLGGVQFGGAVIALVAIGSVIAGVIAGISPAAHGARSDIQRVLRSSGGRSPHGAGASRLRGVLIAGQLAVALVLLAGAGLMVQTLVRIAHADPGFSAEHVLTMRFGVPETKYDTPAKQLAFLEQVIDRMERLPGVRAAGFASRLPLDPSYGVTPLQIEGRVVAQGDRPVVGARVVSERYFSAMGIALVAGRWFAAADRDGAPPVVAINQSLARKLWPGESPIGKRVSFDGDAGPWQRIVAVVGDVAHDDLAAAPVPEVYLPVAQNPTSGGALVVRASGAPALLAPAIRAAISSVDVEQPVIDMRTMTEIESRDLAPRRFSALLLVAFGCAALALTAVGLYGVISFSVTQRTSEIGVRMALGASGADVLALVMRQGGRLVAAGLVTGTVAALWLTRSLSSQLYGVTPSDPMTIVIVALVLVAVAAAATYVPARRATRLDPAQALRRE